MEMSLLMTSKLRDEPNEKVILQDSEEVILTTKEDYIEDILLQHFKCWAYRLAIVGAILFIVFCVVDYIATPKNFLGFLKYRIVTSFILIFIAYLIKQTNKRKLLYILAYAGIIVSTVCIELKILHFEGHQSPYYVGIILIAICVIGFLPAQLSFHIFSSISIYSIYIIPLILFEKITFYREFFVSNAFMVTIFISFLLLRFLSQKELVKRISLEYELNYYKEHLEQILSKRTLELRNSKEQLYKEFTQRKKMIRDLHDNISNDLTSIKFLSDIAEQSLPDKLNRAIEAIRQIRKTTVYNIEQMRDFFWAINPDENTPEDLLLYFKSYSCKLLETLDIDFEFKSKVFTPLPSINSSIRFNLLNIYKEVMTNIIKHSKAKKVRVEITINKDTIEMKIYDNGIGFDTEYSIRYGYGLKNMFKRAKEIGAELDILSKKDKGTTIRLLIKNVV